MTQLPPTAKLAVQTQRARAVAAFIAGVRAVLPDPARATPSQLEAAAALLRGLAARTELFDASSFALHPERPGTIYRLAEDTDGAYALYLSLGEAGKAQPPHDHTTWAIIAGVRGEERNEVYARTPGAEPGRDVLTHVRRVDVAQGSSIVLQPDDVHTIELIGSAAGAHLHFYGLALDRLPGRVVFESTAGGAYRTFGPPAAIFHARVSADELERALRGTAEIALLDVREAGRYAERHILEAANAPLWRIEQRIDRLVPRRGTRIVVVDEDESLAHEAAGKLTRLGYTDVAVLAGGTRGWAADGREVFWGTNVPSKAFGEVIEHEKHTPWIDVDELAARVAAGEDIVVVDSRTPEEFNHFTLPFSHSLPGAELVYRIGELAPDPKTFVVVNCAGRTRSIVGAQTLIDAGIPNKVASLKNGTMEWLLSGRELAYGRQAALAEPGPASLAQARERARAVIAAAGVDYIDAARLAAFEADAAAGERSLYRFDVRTREEYESGHLPGWRWAPGGQLVQATDEYVGTRRARVVLADHDGVRALTTAAWLRQLGAVEVYLFAAPLAPQAAAPGEPARSVTLESGAERVRVLRHRDPAPVVRAPVLEAWLAAADTLVYDVDRRQSYVRGHVPGARYAAPDRLPALLASERARRVVIVSEDGVLAQSVAAELQWQLRRDAHAPAVHALQGGTRAWQAAGLGLDSGAAGVLTGDDDQDISPYLLDDVAARNAGFRAYLDWELQLVAQLERAGAQDIRLCGTAR
ncbi:rhodanese-like domain-containing protein [Achromobacter sp. NFACC18-2]|uniref:rhodanese-like domain-containing protein n=1 Tax=Achromobacter sp. NFACC18-2 TaxID=1564112 RepID=UPI0008BFDAD9|nr:rhodanese-like domain-containing protein [Achromobacter sp. NFACC18-2]SEK11728.1 Predicted metal-dependent enzyme of the double-stranded beta helix superfamily [Achromobacter sp. NFACC18-2]